MSHAVIVHKGRTNVVEVDLGVDVSADTFTSEIRSEADIAAPLIMTWDVDFLTDGNDGMLVLTVDNLVTEQIKATSGFMDLKRMTGTEPVAVFDRPIEVEFRGSVTA
jgi:hypothetical protein